MIFVRKTGERVVLFKGNETLEEIEEQIFRLVYKKHGGNKTQVGKELGITRSTCLNKVRKYKMEEDEDDVFGQDEDRIPGDNDKPSEEKWPSNSDAPVNLTKVPSVDLPSSKDLGGD